jgi:hypothetical protein
MRRERARRKKKWQGCKEARLRIAETQIVGGLGA